MSRPEPARRPGFTLLELLIVIGIIALLIVLAVSVAAKVTGVGKAKVTEQTLRVLDNALTAYIAEKGAPPGPWVLDPRTNGGVPNATKCQPVADAANRSGSGTINSVGLFIVQCQQSPGAAAALKSIDLKYLHDYSPDLNSGNDFTKQPVVTTAFDGWGNPIRYVHPMFKGLVNAPNTPGTPLDLTATASPVQLPAHTPMYTWGISQILRDSTNSDAGLNASARPYFYSCGPDGDPSTTADNIYHPAIPRFAKP